MEIRRPTSFEATKATSDETASTQQTVQSKSASIGSLPAALSSAQDIIENHLQNNNPLDSVISAAAENQIDPAQLPADLIQEGSKLLESARLRENLFNAGPGNAGDSFDTPESAGSSLINRFGQGGLSGLSSKFGDLNAGASDRPKPSNLHSAAAGDYRPVAGGGLDGVSHTTQNEDGSTTTETSTNWANSDGVQFTDVQTATNRYGKTTDLHEERSASVNGSNEKSQTDVHTAPDGSTKSTSTTTSTTTNADGSTTTTTSSTTTETNPDGTVKSTSTTTSTTNTPPAQSGGNTEKTGSQPNPEDEPTSGPPKELTEAEKLLEKLRPGSLRLGPALQGITGRDPNAGGGETVNPSPEYDVVNPDPMSIQDATAMATARKMSMIGNPGSGDLAPTGTPQVDVDDLTATDPKNQPPVDPDSY